MKMLHRPSYFTKELSLELPPLHWVDLGLNAMSPRLLICGSSLDAWLEMQIWQRNFEGNGVKNYSLGWQMRQIDWSLTTTFLPPSLQARCVFTEQLWQEIELDHPSRAFAVAFNRGPTSLVMIGPPTEEAWDRFSAFLNGNDV